MKLYLLIVSIFLASACFGQNFVFDTMIRQPPINSRWYYSQTEFSRIDTLELWNYLLDTTYHGKDGVPVMPIGQLVFWRTKAINDSISKQVYEQAWTPYIAFDIFSIADTSYCYEQSTKTRLYSSCLPPDVGGDIIIVDKFLFLNHSVCVSCRRYDTKVDYCRPVIRYVFSKLNRSKITTLQSIVQQFEIAKGELPKRETNDK